MATKPSSAGAVPGGISGSVGLPEEFKELRGHLLVEAIFARYGAGTMTIPWINEHANPDSPEYRNIRRDPCNRKIMESLAEAYADRILHTNAITYNHRSEAMYRALKRAPENIYVKRALASGLENVRMLSANTPVEVRAALCAMHNRYHEGQSDSFVSLLDDAEAIMAEWDKKINGPNGTGLTTRNPNYESYLEAFVFKEKQATQWGDSLNFFKQTSVLNNHWVQFYVKEPVKEWSNANVDFTSMDATNRDIIKILHQLTVVVVNGLNKFYPKEYIGAALVEAVKFCAAEDGKAEENTKTKKKKAKGKAVESQGSEGQIPWSNLAFPNLEGDVRPSRGVPGVPSADVGRPKHALDDFMHIFFEIVGVAKEKLPENQKAVQSFQASTVSLFRHAISCFYEFVFSGSAAVNGKFCRNYSMFRPELQAFMKSAVDMALSNASVGLGPAGSTTSDKTIPLFADFNLDAGLQIGHLRDESDEVRALQRLKQGVPLCRESGMANFVATILELPVDSNANFITAKQRLLLDPSFDSDTALVTVLQKIYDELRSAVPQHWVNMAADVCDLMAVRLQFVEDSGKIFKDDKHLLERFAALRSFYTLTILRDLGRLTKKVVWDINTRLLISSLHVDMEALMRRSEKLSIETKTKDPDSAASAAPPHQPHPVAMLIPGFDVLQSTSVAISSETWARNWAALLTNGNRSPDAAFSFLKVYVKSAGDELASWWTDSMKPESAASAFNSRKRKANPETQGGGGGESEGEHDEHEAAPDKQQPPDILSSMTLGQLSVCGMEFVARSEHYASLFGFDNDDLETIRMNSIDLKLVQMRLEVFLWDWRPGWVRVASRQSLQLFNCSSLLLDHFLEHINTMGRFLVWNFGNATEEAEAFAAGSKQKLSKVTKKTESERLLFDNKKAVEEKDKETSSKICMPFVGSISTLKASNGYLLTEVLGMPFFVNPPPNLTATSSMIVPAWLVPATSKKDNITVEERQIEVLTDSLRWTTEEAAGAAEASERSIKVTLKVPVLVPNTLALRMGVPPAADSPDVTVPLSKAAPPKPKGRAKLLPEPAMPDAPVIGLAAAMENRREAMNKQGMATSMPAMTKEERKAEKDRKKLLSNAKHLLK
ncbi:unnamed protein product [Durusdinium trenchii]|uniref:Uncharacterized protein n=1 Tax=Durusdinium trenchii TaxID=1381693 RepID=A0ABP0LNM6_9DINO